MLLLLLAVQAAAVASTCTGNASLVCLQHKIVNAVDRINSIPEIPVTEWISIVPNRTKTSQFLLPLPQARLKNDGIWYLLGRALDDFIDTRIVKFSLPGWAEPSGHSIDVDLGRALTEVTGRKKKDKKGAGMGMLMMGMMGKMAMMSMAVIKMKAMKALIIGSIALLLSKLQIIKLLASKKDDGGSHEHVIVLTGGHGGGHGGGGHGGGGGGGHGGGGGGGHGGGGSTVHVVHETVAGGSGGGWSSGGGGGHGGGSDWQGGGGGGDSWGGGGNGGGWSSGGGGGGGGGHGWGKRAYYYDTYTKPPNTTVE